MFVPGVSYPELNYFAGFSSELITRIRLRPLVLTGDDLFNRKLSSIELNLVDCCCVGDSGGVLSAGPALPLHPGGTVQAAQNLVDYCCVGDSGGVLSAGPALSLHPGGAVPAAHHRPPPLLPANPGEKNLPWYLTYLPIVQKLGVR